MSRRRRKPPISAINVVPYLDVLLVLLVIFMITTPLFNQGVVELPKVGETPLPNAQTAALEVLYEQTTRNPYRLIDHKDNSETAQLSEAGLLAELGKKSVLYDDPYIIVSAQGTLQYQQVFHLVGVLRDAGFDNIALSAQNRGGGDGN